MYLQLLVCCMLCGNVEGEASANAKPRKDPSAIELSCKQAKAALIKSHPDPKNVPGQTIEVMIAVLEHALPEDRAAELKRLESVPEDVLDFDTVSQAFILYLAKYHDRDSLIGLLETKFPRYIGTHKSEWFLASYCHEEVVTILVEAARGAKDDKTRNEIIFALSSALKNTYGFNPAEMARHDNDAVDSDSWWRRMRAEDVKPQAFLERAVAWYNKNKGNVEVDNGYASNELRSGRGELFRVKTTRPAEKADHAHADGPR